MVCPVCQDPNVGGAHDAQGQVTVRCSACHVFTITADAIQAIASYRGNDNVVFRSQVDRLAGHLAGCDLPRPDVITCANWQGLAPVISKHVVLYRTHENGAVGEVLMQSDGRFTGQKRVGERGESCATASIIDLNRAMAEADRHAHATGCNWRCGAWTSTTGRR